MQAGYVTARLGGALASAGGVLNPSGAAAVAAVTNAAVAAAGGSLKFPKFLPRMGGAANNNNLSKSRGRRRSREAKRLRNTVQLF